MLLQMLLNHDNKFLFVYLVAGGWSYLIIFTYGKAFMRNFTGSISFIFIAISLFTELTIDSLLCLASKVDFVVDFYFWWNFSFL